MVRADLACRLDPTPVGEPDVHHDDVRSRAVSFIDGLSDRRGFRGHVDVVLGCKHRPDPVAHDLVIIDEHHPERRTLRLGHRGMLARVGSSERRFGAVRLGRAQCISRTHDRVGDAFEEVLECRFCHPREKRAIDHPADRAERRNVSSAHRELRAPGSDGCDLEIGVERWEEVRTRGRRPSQGKHELGSDANGSSELDGDPSPNADGVAETDVGEEPVPSMVGSLGQPRKP